MSAEDEGVGSLAAPSHEAVLEDLLAVRSAGVGKLRMTPTPALREVAALLDLCDRNSREPAPIKELLTRAVNELGGGAEQECTEYVLGLARGTALWPVGQRLKTAAEHADVGYETFRKDRVRVVLGYLAELILELCHGAHLRHARVEMDERRHPADSRLAVQWVERFEAYYRIWTPINALGANLEAALDTYLEEPSDHLPWDPDSKEEYDPVMQARGYARAALYNYAEFRLELKRFMTRHGGLWLASGADVEQEIANAVYRVGWHNDLDDEDDSWLRRHLADARHQETEHFWNVIRAFPQGLHIHDLWQHMVEKGVGLEKDEQSQKGSQAWLSIRACQDYCALVDADWMRIADWYRPNHSITTTSGKEQYAELMKARGTGGELNSGIR